MERTEWDNGKWKEQDGTKEKGRIRIGTMGNGRKRMEHNGKGEERSGTEQNKKRRKWLGVKGKIMTAVYAET